ncbi:MAG: hypothetical protein CVU56_29290, partial [Deltaproteobacteria bacterium HGW-Deltaproteobacteria-14]
MLRSVLRLLTVVIVTLLAAAPALAGPCDTSGAGDLSLADAAGVAFVGRLARDAKGALTYRVTHPIAGEVRRGQRITVRAACPVRPSGREHVVFAGADLQVIGGRDGLQRARPERVAALTAWGAAEGDDARLAVLLGRYRNHQDGAALELLIDAPRLLGRLDDAARDALLREIGRVPWGTAEPVALARLGRPMALGLLTLADRRCSDGAFDTACARAIPEALAYARRAAPAAPDQARLIREGPDRSARLRALAACEERLAARYDGDPQRFGFMARLLAGA